MQELITLTVKEKVRYEVIRDSLKGIIKIRDASLILNLSSRQIYRLRKRVRDGGIKGIVHRLRTRPSVRKINTATHSTIKTLYKTRYYGFNFTHFTEYLNQKENIKISRESVRKILRSEETLYPHRPKRQPKHRIRRQPMPQEGLLSQMDTSEHLWIPALDRNIYLILIVDDATNKIQNARFTLSDTTIENMKVLKEFFQMKGLPYAIYLDRDSKFKTTRYTGIHYNLKGEPYPDTQIKRALNSLGIQLIYATSPQAKGRIERDFRTLQDRLINELRLHRITTIHRANHYLKEHFIPTWNRIFTRPAHIKRPAYRNIPPNISLNDIFSLKYKRKACSDNTISYNGSKYQILPDPYRASYAKCEIEVFEHLDGKISLFYKGRRLTYRKIARIKPGKDEGLAIKRLLSRGDISILQKR